ncbi:MAG: DUF3168 domain-containing protein [Muribaculaceae bacterium]|nr:DUF3168 domain-containing protein [Muribaculaceae bacterium]
MAVNKTSLSAGLIIRSILLEDAEVAARINKIFPIGTDSADLPYLVYRRVDFAAGAVKTGHNPDEVQIEVLCCTAGYDESVELAEAVRKALDNASGEADGITMRGCRLTGGEELLKGEAYVQQLIFTIKV